MSSHNQDVHGDLYEYLLSYLTTAGRNGQFRTPRHIIRMVGRFGAKCKLYPSYLALLRASVDLEPSRDITPRV